jgi:immune inhibitor A
VQPKFHSLLATIVLIMLAGLSGCHFGATPPAASTAVAQPSDAPVVDARPPGVLAASTGRENPPSITNPLADMIVPPRDLRDLTVRLRPGIDEVPLVVNQHAPDFQVGDELRFWVHDVNTRSNHEITAELVHKTDVAYAWVESGQLPDTTGLAQAVDHFSTHSYPAVVAFFGNEWNPGVDNDPRLHILHSAGLGNSVAGYYSSSDQYSRLANPFSNEKELFYINLNMVRGAANYRNYETVLTHELQHMIHWHKDSNESTWVNEGMSEFAQEVAGFGVESNFVGSFVVQPDTQLNAWNDSSMGNANHYGAAYLFIHYLHQRFGAGFLTSLAANPANSIEGVQLTLDEQGHTIQFDDLFADWVVANFADQPEALGLESVYGYPQLNFSRMVTAERFDAYPVPDYAATVGNYATDYIRLDGEGDLTVHFAGQTETRLVATQPVRGQYVWWAPNVDMSDSRLTRQFDLSSVAAGAPVEMKVEMWWDIERDYDYGYVMASRDGLKWEILPGRYTVTDNPAGNSFGPGYTGIGNADDAGEAQWASEEFDLSAYAGAPVWLRFEYITDDGITGPGWLVDDVRLPAIDYEADFEQDDDGWESEGWLRTDNRLPQRWLVQVLTFADDKLVDIQRMMMDGGQNEFTIAGLNGDRYAILAISGLAPITTQPATYTLTIDALGR